MSPNIEIQMIAVVVAIACSLPGVFLVLRKMAMMSDAITHTILLGIVIGFFIVQDLSSPWLMVGATVIGLLTVYMVELLTKTKLVSADSSIGIVFPFLFSIAIILITRYAGNTHLDTDSVLLGEIAYAPFNRMHILGYDIGAKALYTMGGILLVNLALILIFYKEIKIAIFDTNLAAVLGFSPLLIHYALMTSVSVTAIGAFEAVGSILVIAFMIGPPVTAYLLTDNLTKMLFLSAIFGFINAIGGYYIAMLYDVSIAGSMALFTGVSFLVIFCFAPKRGFFTVIQLRRRQKVDFAKKSMLFHILQHEGTENEAIENGVNSLYKHLNLNKKFLMRMISQLIAEKKIQVVQGVYKLTEPGKRYTVESYEAIIESFRAEYTR